MIRPMLGKEADLNKLQFPVYASTKLDGVRALVVNGVVMSRTGKPIRNKHVQKLFGQLIYDGLDGELIVGNPTDPNVFQKTTSGVMSEDGTPDVTYYVFDSWKYEGTYETRSIYVDSMCFSLSALNPKNRIKFVEQILIRDLNELKELEKKVLAQGYEGLMLRKPDTYYKNGRSTVKGAELLKLKRFKDSEATIINYFPLYRNDNDTETDELGYTTRSSAKEGLVARPMLGSIEVIDLKTNKQFNIGSGFNEEQRIELWKNRDSLIDSIVKYKYFPISEKDKPRFPIFIGFRDKDDI